MAASRTPKWHWWMLPLVLVVQRATLFSRYGSDFTALLRANPDWIAVQLQARDTLDAQPFASLWYLQQSPPVPNAVTAALLQVLEWPLGGGWALVVLQMLCTLAVALLMVELARRLVPLWAATALGLLWLVSPDIVVLETTGLGQTFYENLAALGVVASAFAFVRWCETSDRRWAVGLGVVLGLLALTRSSFGFYSLPILALMGLRIWWRPRPERRAACRQVLVCAALALSIQGAWALKNLAVFGHWTWPASTWGGASLAASLDGVGAGDDLSASILSEPERYEPWFVAFVRDYGVQPWTSGWQGTDFCPEQDRADDLRVTERLHGQNRPENSQCLRRMSEALGSAALRFLWLRPDVLLAKLKVGYATYWFPMRYHGGQYLGLFATEWRVERSLRPWRSARQLLAGELPEPAFLVAGRVFETTRRPASLFTLDLPATVWWLVEIVVLHLLVPLVFVAVTWRVWRTRRMSPGDTLWLMLALTYAYSASLHNLVELGENMRFRWNVEAVIWLLVADALARLGAWLTDAARSVQRKTSR